MIYVYILLLFHKLHYSHLKFEKHVRDKKCIVVFSSPDPKGHVSYCHHEASVVRRRPSSGVRRPSSLAFHILIFSSETTGPIWTKLGRDGPWVVPFQNCIRGPRLPSKMAAMAINRKFTEKSLKIFSSETAGLIGTKLCWNDP